MGNTTKRWQPHDDLGALWEIVTQLKNVVTAIGAVPGGGGGSGPTVWGQILGLITNQTDLQTALNSKSPVGHNHDAAYDPLGAASTSMASHVGASDPHPVYLTEPEGDAAYDAIGTAAAAVAAHEGEGDPHSQYLTPAEGAAAFDSLGAASSAVASHAADTDPHPQYLTPVEGFVLFEVLGNAQAAVAAHVALADPHPQYLTPAEGNAAYQPLDSDLTTLASSITAAGHALVEAADAPAQRTAIGLGNVDNTSDASKPVSTAQQSALDGKAALSHAHAIADTTGLQTALDGKAALSHTHPESDVTGLTADLAGKADTVHSHAIADVTGLVAALAAKARSVYNASVAVQGPNFATDTYLVGSSIAIPSGALQAKSIYRCRFNVTKTNAGTATPIINVRFGTAGTTADTARCTLTFAAQTAAVDEGMFELEIVFRTVGSGTSAVLQAIGKLTHRLATTGLSSVNTGIQIATSAGFDSTVANSIIGLSVNGGTSAAWTVSIVSAELLNLV